MVKGFSNSNSSFLFDASRKHYLVLVCESIPHPTTSRYRVISVVSPRPLVKFQNISKKHYLWRFWSYVSPNNVAKFLSNIHELAIVIVFHNFFCSWKQLNCPSCMKTLLIAKSLTSMWTLNALMKFRNFGTRANESFSFKSLNAFYCSCFHSKNNSFFRRPKSGFVICVSQAWRKLKN